jgi:nucleoside 2-deoxyribosyltransferase
MKAHPKIYFACSIRGGGDTSSYEAILEIIKATGAHILSEIFVHDAIHYGGSPLPANEIYARDIAMIHDADMIIAEVSNPSLGVGYELAFAETLNKPILCLYNESQDKKLSAMISGNPYMKVAYYAPSELPVAAIKDFIAH